MASPILASASPLIALCALVCPVGMGAMMWFMARGARSRDAQSKSPATLDDLRQEHERLGTQIESLEDSEAGAGESDAEPAVSGRSIRTTGPPDTLQA
jgi:hypothetical protein